VVLDGRSRRTVRFDAGEFAGFRHGYAGTIYKGQGRTFDQTYLYHSQHWRASSSYVALTRHRNKTEIFVARDTASNFDDLARQVSRTDDRRAASYFQPPLLDRIAEELPRSIDWRRALHDPAYRRALQQLQGLHQPKPERTRSFELER
jgi:predicted lipase